MRLSSARFGGQNAQPQGLIRSNGLRFESFGLTNMARQKGRDVTGIPSYGKRFFSCGNVTLPPLPSIAG